MTTNPVGWFEIYAQDMSRAKEFYESVFATHLARLENPGIEMRAFPMDREGKGASGSLVKYEGYPSGGNGTVVYFSCADCAVEAKRVPASGGRIFKDKFSIGQYGFIALFTDTEGNMIGLHSMQ